MTREEKQLLLKDLCGRLPYGVKLGFKNSDLILVPKEFNTYTMHLSTNQIYPKSDSMIIGHIYDVWNYRPYLRPMSSMTEEEKYIYRHMLGATLNSEGESIMFVYVEDFPTVIDWLNAHHFDYRCLIEKGLALEAPEDMYKTE